MTRPITNSYRIQILQAVAGILRRSGPGIIKPAERDEMVRVLEDMVDRLREKAGGQA